MYTTYFPPQYSGAAKQAISLAKHLRGRGHHVEFVTVKWPGLAERDICEGFPVFRVEMGGGKKHRELRLWWNLLRFVLNRRNDFDIIHSHGAYYTNSIVGPISRMVGWKSLVKASLAENDLHGMGVGLTGRIHYQFLRAVDAYVAISRDLEEEFQNSGLPSEKILYQPNGVDTERFRPSTPDEKRDIRRRLNLPQDVPIALSVGVFDQRKNIGWLMEEWVNRDAFGSGAFLVALGPQSREDVDGSFIASLRCLSERNPKLLRLEGHTDDIETYYRAADLFILPSHSEGMPNVVLEAMASGLPCVATRVSGTKELVVDGETGYSFSPCDAEELGWAVLNSLRDDASLGDAARARMVEKFSLTTLAERYEHLYGRLRSNS